MDTSARELIEGFLRREKLVRGGPPILEPLGGDGSDRRFFRVRGAGLLAVLPSATIDRAREEARASCRIGRHLRERGVAVPEIHGFDEATGLIVFEDLGDTLLHQLVQRLAGNSAELLAWYRKAIDELAKLQVAGSEGFDPDFCWDTSRYDVQLMRERESGYFLAAFCRDLLGLGEPAAALEAELEQLAGLAAREPDRFLLHRDYQSRNLMVKGERIYIIDFQGARFGPLAYDPASLLLDPYAGLEPSWQNLLLEYYLEAVNRYCPVDPESFRAGYFFLRLQRNLQIIGAYAFLSGRGKKPFFRTYLLPALAALNEHLRQPAGAAFPRLRELAAKCNSELIIRNSELKGGNETDI